MKLKLAITLFLATVSAIAQPSRGNQDVAGAQSAALLNAQAAETAASIAERQKNTAIANAQYQAKLDEQARQQQISALELQNHIDSLKAAVASDENFLQFSKNLKDGTLSSPYENPWRKINGEIHYLGESQRPFFPYSASVVRTIDDGILITNVSGSGSDQTYFLDHFPFRCADGDKIQFVAYSQSRLYKNSGSTYHVLDYGVPCERPPNAQEIEDQIVSSAQVNLSSDQKALSDFLDAIEKAKEEATQKAKAAKQAAEDRALKYDEDLAAQGDPAGLRRMGERYQEGHDVEKDIAKAQDYFKKADVATQAEANRISAENQAMEKAALQQKFLRNLSLADKGDVDCMVYVGKCYRDGKGVEIDSTKARQYFQKASDSGSTEATSLLAQLQ